MAEFNGIKQATIFYKVAEGSREPLDVNNVPTSESGNKQAILLMEGFGNPDPDKYEVEGYFLPGDVVRGVPSTTRDDEQCPPGDRAPWVLDGGTWHNENFWVNNETWNFNT